MIVEGIEYPETVMTQLIGEQTLTIDHLRFKLKQNMQFLEIAIKEGTALRAELDELKARIADLVEKTDG